MKKLPLPRSMVSVLIGDFLCIRLSGPGHDAFEAFRETWLRVFDWVRSEAERAQNEGRTTYLLQALGAGESATPVPEFRYVVNASVEGAPEAPSVGDRELLNRFSGPLFEDAEMVAAIAVGAGE